MANIGIRYTEEEWKIIDEHLSANRIDSIQAFINIRLYKAVKSLHEYEASCKCDKILRNYFIPEDICSELAKIAEYKCVPLSSIIRRNFIHPILLENSKKTGLLL